MYQHHKFMTAIGLFGVIFLTSLLTFLLFPQALLSPISASSRFQFFAENSPAPTTAKIVYGFLPFWNVKKVSLQPELTHLGYFSLSVDGQGNILQKKENGTDLGFYHFKSVEVQDMTASIQQQNKKVEVVLTQFNNDEIAELLTHPQAHQNLIASLDKILQNFPVQGVNIDFEYSSEVTPELRQGFVSLIKKINTHLEKKYPPLTLSIDMYPSAANNRQIWDIENIEPFVDYIIVMTYDFHRSSSPMAGPVAPLFGGKKLWSSDVTMNLRQFLKYVPSKKILLGIPFYGYEWRTTSHDPQSPVYPNTGATASFQRIQQLLQQKESLGLEEKWNEEALSPYITYTKNNQHYIIYYENSRSVSYKLDLANQLDLGGIAIWALGYEKENRELWDLIKRKM